ncbi:MAG: hypothetical protein MJ177_04525 [Clostridia bacterium]|nr:hypothetical protein [Clostridia bacterium]
MKKLTAIILTVVMFFTLTTPAFADSFTFSEIRSDVPVIYIAGDSNAIWYDNETKNFKIESLFNIFSDTEEDSLKEAAINILLPFIMEGITFNKWDDYYEAVEKEFTELFEPIRLDENGNIPEGSDSGIATWQKNDNKTSMTRDRKLSGGGYEERTYNFYYDWRLDPVETAEQLHTFIEAVKKVTHNQKICISARCIGCNVVMAYIDKYGIDSLKGLAFDVSTSLGAEFLGGIISGDFGIDGNSITRLLADLKVLEGTEVNSLITSTVELLSNTGVLDTMSDVARAEIYAKIEYGIISALATSTLMTMPSYWAMVPYEDFDEALVYVFGKEGSEKRKTYAGLIEKIKYYNEKIKKNIYPLMKSLKYDEAGEELENSVNLCLISKYGLQMVPLLKDGSVLGDQYVSAARSSFGATTSDIYTTLSDDYIAKKEALGLGAYISADKQVDASTCLFPDYTWFFKGVSHGYYTTPESDIIMTVLASDVQLGLGDIQNKLGWTQFTVYDFPTHTAEPMNEENCHNENWTADKSIDRPETKHDKIYSLITSLLNWVNAILDYILSLLKK